MSEKLTTKSVTLSNDGMADYLRVVEEARPHFTIKNGEIKVEMVGKGFKILAGKTKDGITHEHYKKELFKKIKTNKIEDTDKVFFTKNSKYPRTSFNRYSTKARRIEAIDKAHKIVLNYPDLNSGYYYGSFYVIGDYAIKVIDGKTSQFFTGLDKKYSSNKLVKKLINMFTSSYYNRSDALGTLNTYICELQGITYDTTVRTIGAANQNDLASMICLLEGRDIDKFVTDAAVNNYIDNFKMVLDDSNYTMVHTALTQGDKNITMGMKLLENMNINGSRPFLYALMAEAQGKNGTNLARNKVYNNVGMKNIRKNYNLDFGLNYYSDAQTNLRLVNRLYKEEMKTDTDKVTFLRLTKDFVEHNLKKHLGDSVYNMIKYRMKTV